MKHQYIKSKMFTSGVVAALLTLGFCFSGCGVGKSSDSATGGVAGAARSAVSSITGNAQL